MRLPLLAAFAVIPALAVAAAESPSDADILARIYATALADHAAYRNLQSLVTEHPGRLSGSKSLEDAVQWAEAALQAAGVDRTEMQPVKVPHWERGTVETVAFTTGSDSVPLQAVALGGSVATAPEGLRAPVVELTSLDQLATADVKGKIVFFNRPMDQKLLSAGQAYGTAGDARNKGPAEAAKYGAVGVVIHSLTHATDDVPHTGNTRYVDQVPKIPAAALGHLSAEKLSAALRAHPELRIAMKLDSRWCEDAPSHNVLGEIRGSESPEKIILVGGHLDSWDIAPGAHDDGAGIVQSIDVIRILRAIGYRPKHTIRCVCFVNEENGLRGATEYLTIASRKNEAHLLALESDNGGFDPRGFTLGNDAKDAAARLSRFAPLFAPYGILLFREGRGGADVGGLQSIGAVSGELTSDSQRYFDIHHTREDSLDKVNARELQLGAAAMAALVYLVDRHGI